MYSGHSNEASVQGAGRASGRGMQTRTREGRALLAVGRNSNVHLFAHLSANIGF